MKAKVYVTLKPGILDPQGKAILDALSNLGYHSVQDVRTGKYLEVDLGNRDRSGAEAQIRAMCEKLLANPVIEEYRFEVMDGDQ